MLPQGRFQAFLRARSEERHALLQQLFRTAFDHVERWLREHRVSVRRASEPHATAVAGLVSRLSETADRPALDDESHRGPPHLAGRRAGRGSRPGLHGGVAVAVAEDTSDRATRRLADAERVRDLQAVHAEATAVAAGTMPRHTRQPRPARARAARGPGCSASTTARRSRGAA